MIAFRHISNFCLIIGAISSLSSCSHAQDSPSTDINSRIILGNEHIDHLVTLTHSKSVAIIGNHTSVLFADTDTTPTHLVDTLISRGINVLKVFAPEHGFRGDQANGAIIHDGIDSETGLPIFSLHGKHRKPSAESLANIDVVIFDIQDVGTRFYTYLSTLLLVMEAAAENNVEVIVLDRPNPHCHHVKGPMLDADFSSFVGLAPVPIIYGMTLGEIALMANGELWLKDGIQADLNIIACENYSRTTHYSIPISPSPNLPTDASISLYPSLCFLEPTNVSIGRGTPTPFELVGFPNNPSGTYSFTPVATPGASPHPKYENTICSGENLHDLGMKWISSSESWDLNILVRYADLFRYEDGELVGFFTSKSFFDKLVGTDELRLALESNESIESLEKSWEEDIEKFKSARTPYLLYLR